MAFSKELEDVIEAALADGVITEKERAVLHKRAVQEGVDPEELDVVIDGRLAKMKREVDWLKPAPPRSVKYGNMAKCPSCGSPYIPGTGKCPDCGHIFQNVEANHAAQRLTDGIAEITSRFSDKIASASRNNFKGFGISDADALEMQKDEEIGNYIRNFVIPSSKDDLLEFIISIDAKIKNDKYGDYCDEFKVKYEEACKKARVIFPDDPQFASLLGTHNKDTQENFIYKYRWAIGILILLLLSYLFR